MKFLSVLTPKRGASHAAEINVSIVRGKQWTNIASNDNIRNTSNILSSIIQHIYFQYHELGESPRARSELKLVAGG